MSNWGILGRLGVTEGHRWRKGSVVGGTMASADHKPITGVSGQSPQRGPGAEPLVRGSGRRSPPEAESILVIRCPTEPANLAPFQKCPYHTLLRVDLSTTTNLSYRKQYALLRSIGVRVEGGGGSECMVLPNPVIGKGGCAPRPQLRRLCSGSSAMSPFDRAHTTSYSTLIETMRLSCTVFKI